MNERIVPGSELTVGRTSSTINVALSSQKAGSTMDTGQNEQPPRAGQGATTNRPHDPTEVSGPQAEREARRAFQETLNVEGRQLTPEQRRSLEKEFERVLRNPQNETGEFNVAPNPEGRQNVRDEGFNGGRYFADIMGRTSLAQQGEFGKNLLNKLYDEASSRTVDLAAETPNRDELLAQLERERKATMDAIKERNDALNPSRERREESGGEIAGHLKDLINAARSANRGEKITSANSHGVKEIIDYIESVPFGGPEHYELAFYIAKNVSNDMSEEMRKLLFEQVWEKFVGRADSLPEEQHYRLSLGGLEATNIFDKIKGLADTEFRVEDDITHEKTNKFALYLNELAHARENMHDLNLSFRVGENYKKAVVEQLSAKGLNFVQNELAGVNPAVLLWEKYAAAKVAERHQWLSQGDIADIEKDVKATMDAMGEQGLLKHEGRDLMPWEISRAARLGKISFAGTQRLALYVGYGNIPPETQGRIGSIPYEYVARAILNFKTGPLRFFAGDKAQAAYMNLILRKLMQDEHGKDNGKFLELFGADKRMIAANSMGAFDMESHGWRSQLVFLNNILLDAGEGKNQTFMEFINGTIMKYQKKGADVNFEGMGAVDKSKEKEFNSEIENAVIGQRLYLSVLTRFPDADKGMKADLWRKIAMLKPSTIMSLLPKDMIVSEGDREMMDKVRQKLYIAEMKRVQDDSKDWVSIAHEGHKAHVETKEQLANEVRQFRSAVAGTDVAYKYQILTKADFNADEQAFVKKMIDRGIAQAGKLAKAEFSHTLQIDDAPFIAWTKTASGESGRGGMAAEDMVRILLSDQGTVAEAWGALMGHIESPQNPTQEAFGQFVDKFGSIFGRGSAQKKIEPEILAYLEFVTAYDKYLWTGGLERFTNEPISPISEFYRESHIGMDESGRSVYLRSLAQKNVIADNTQDKSFGEYHNMTQLEYLRLRGKARGRNLFVRWLRNMVQDLPFALAGVTKDLFTSSAKGGI